MIIMDGPKFQDPLKSKVKSNQLAKEDNQKEVQYVAKDGLKKD